MPTFLPPAPPAAPSAGVAWSRRRPPSTPPTTVTLLVGHGAADGARRGPGRRGAPVGADGGHPQGQDGLRRRQPVPGRPVRAARQPRLQGRLRPRRRAAHGGQRLPLPRVLPVREDRGPAGPARRPHRTAGARGPRGRRGRRPGAGGPAADARAQARPAPPRPGAGVVRVLAGAAAAVRGPGLRPQAARAAPTQGGQPRGPDQARAPRRGGGPARGRRRGLHLGHRDGDHLAGALRADAVGARAARLVQPRVDGQRDAAGAGRRGPRPRPAGGGVLRGRGPHDAAR